MAGRTPGPKPLTSRDWLFGSRPRRLLIEHVLESTPPLDGWTKTALADAADVSRHGGIDAHVDGLRELGLLIADGARWAPAVPQPAVGAALRQVTRALETETSDVASPLRTPRLRSPDPLREIRRARNSVARCETLDPAAREAVLAALDAAAHALAPAR